MRNRPQRALGSQHQLRPRTNRLLLERLEQRLLPGETLLGMLAASVLLGPDTELPGIRLVPDRPAALGQVQLSSLDDRLPDAFSPVPTSTPASSPPRETKSGDQLQSQTGPALNPPWEDPDLLEALASAPVRLVYPNIPLESAAETDTLPVPALEIQAADVRAILEQVEPSAGPLVGLSNPPGKATSSQSGAQGQGDTAPSDPLVTQPEGGEKSAALPDVAGEQALVNYVRVPLSFEANLGQVDAQVDFLSRGPGYSLFLTGTEAVLSLNPQETGGTEGQAGGPRLVAATDPAVFRMQVLGADPTAQAVGRDQLAGVVNYFLGDDPAKWRTDVATYGRVEYQGVYPGINLVYYGNQQQLEYDFVVAPGADPGVIQLAFTGADRVEVDAAGDLVIQAGNAELRQHRPVTYQEVDGVRREVASRFEVDGGQQVSFVVGAYDESRPLVIDPVLVYSTYLGGSEGDYNRGGIALDAAGNVYLTGQTGSTNFPTVNPIQPTFSGGFDVYVAKLNATGSALLYSTYLGGSGINEAGWGIAVDATGNAYVTGLTDSPNFPRVNPLQPTLGGSIDAFVAKLNATGTALLYSTFLGGNETDRGNEIAVDGAGNVYMAGETWSVNFPTAVPLQGPSSGVTTHGDAYVAKLNAAGTQLVYSTFLGGTLADRGTGITVDEVGSAYVTGVTSSANFPTVNAFQSTHGGGFTDAFVAKLNPAGSALLYSTFLGGSNNDGGADVVVDADGNAFVAGYSSSGNFPTLLAVQPTFGGGFNEAIVAKLDAGGTLFFSTYLGGNDGDEASDIGLDAAGNVYVTGGTHSRNFPTVNPLQPFVGGFRNAFVAKLTLPRTGPILEYATYLGGGDDIGYAIAVDASGNAYVAGTTSSRSFPTVNPLQPTYGGGAYDSFLAKIENDFNSPLFVMELTSTRTGFIARFNRPIDGTLLNLFDTRAGTLGAADATLIGTVTGAISGSLLLDPTSTRVTFVRVGEGVLPADTYTVTLRSAANGFRAPTGGPLLDGNRDGTAGDDFVTTFTVGAFSAVRVSLPDFSRGPGQPVDVPATRTGLPFQLNNGNGITSVRLTLRFDPALLTIREASVGATVPAGATVTLDTTVRGRAVLVFTSPTPLTPGAINFVTLTAEVPAEATYGASHVLDITGLTVNNGAIPARDDDAVHLAAFLGEVSANRVYSALDAVRMLAVAVGLDSGFLAYRQIHPLVIADITGDGLLSSIDATRVLQEGLGIDRPEIPPVP